MMVLANSDFRDSNKFAKAYQRAKATGSFGRWETSWRIHVLCWAASEALKVEGDFIECGTEHGGTAMAVLTFTELWKTKRNFFLLDTFHGLDHSLLSTNEKNTIGKFMDYPSILDKVHENFRSFDCVKIIPGSIPSTLNEVTSDKIAFLHLDLNAAKPERAALEILWPRLVPNAIVVLDDYGWPLHHEQKASYDEFFNEKAANILRLPTNQAVVIK